MVNLRFSLDIDGVYRQTGKRSEVTPGVRPVQVAEKVLIVNFSALFRVLPTHKVA